MTLTTQYMDQINTQKTEKLLIYPTHTGYLGEAARVTNIFYLEQRKVVFIYRKALEKQGSLLSGISSKIEAFVERDFDSEKFCISICGHMSSKPVPIESQIPSDFAERISKLGQNTDLLKQIQIKVNTCDMFKNLNPWSGALDITLEKKKEYEALIKKEIELKKEQEDLGEIYDELIKSKRFVLDIE